MFVQSYHIMCSHQATCWFSVVCNTTVLIRSKWPRGLRSGTGAARFLGLRARIPPVTWMYVSCDSCVFSGGGLCDGPIPPTEES